MVQIDRSTRWSCLGLTGLNLIKTMLALRSKALIRLSSPWQKKLSPALARSGHTGATSHACGINQHIHKQISQFLGPQVHLHLD